VMAAMLAESTGAKDFQLETPDDFIRMGLFVQIVGKLCRYAQDFDRGHIDSMHDIGVYAFMLEAEDRRIQAPSAIPGAPGTDPVAWREFTTDRLYHDIINDGVTVLGESFLPEIRKLANAVAKRYVPS
jgi:hypothetical protein